MDSLALTGCVIAIVVLFVLSANRGRELDDVRRALLQIRRELNAMKAGTAPEARSVAPQPVVAVESASEPAAAPPAKPAPFVPPVRPPQPDRQGGIERQFGGRAFVWIGGVALALAGFFLVKYSIETGILTEDVRVILGVVFGLALLAGSQAVRARKQIADGTRIAQALAGAGIADLYGSLFAATTLYHLIPSWLGFAAMAAVTATALILSLRHGSPIAVLGLIGGYATPTLIQGDPNTPLLFGYLYLVCAGIIAVARKREWWWLPAPALVIAYLWVTAWLLMGHGAADDLWLSLFLIAIAATAVVANHDAPEVEIESAHYILRNLAPAGSLVLMAAVAHSAQFSTFEWAMFATLSICALLLAWFESHTYRFVPWLAMAVNLVMLADWQNPDPTRVAIVTGGFALLFAAGAQVLIRRSDQPILWAGLSAAASLFYFLLAYSKLDTSLVAAVSAQTAEFVWGGIAVTAAALFAGAVTEIYVLNSEPHIRRVLQAVYAVAATTLVSLAFAIIFEQSYLPFAAAVEIFALSWIAVRTEIAALRSIAMVLTGLFVLLLLPGLGALFRTEGMAVGLLHALFRFGLPAFLFAAASLNWRESIDDRFVQVLEAGSVLLAACLCFRIVAVLLIGHGAQYNLAIDALQTIIVLTLAIAALRMSAQFARPALTYGGGILAVVAALRIVLLHLMLDNPIVVHQWVGSLPIVNVIVAAYAVPAVLCLVLGRDLASQPQFLAATRVAAFALAAVALTLLVRQFFHGDFLDASGAGNAEVYAYSVAWLVAGVALLLSAVAIGDPMMRVVSLVVMLLTVGKVFLYDASQLTGLWRVVSFLGLGFSLLGLSWFYSRFVFSSRTPE